MRKKLVIGSFVLIALVILSFVLYWYHSTQNIRKTVISSLEKQLEFCEIIKDNIWFDRGKFWLICNNRPFYAEYKNGNVSYELNGWNYYYTGELKREQCEFYKSEKMGNDNFRLIFYCPDLQFAIKVPFVMTFEFDVKTLKMQKIKENSLSDILPDDIKISFDLLQNCEFTNLSLVKAKGRFEINLIKSTFSCNGKNVYIFTDLRSISVPFFENGNTEEIAKMSFENLLGETCEIRDILKIGGCIEITSNCTTGFDFNIAYCSQLNYSYYEIVSKREVCGECFPDMLVHYPWVLFPPLTQVDSLNFYSEKCDYNGCERIYTINQLPLKVYVEDKKILFGGICDEVVC